jgi:hypothetical protein
MKLCDDCWTKLKEAIEARGLMHLVAKNGQTATEMLTQQLKGNDCNETYDPLMSAFFAILGNLLDAFGLNILVDDAPCPLCYLTECSKAGCGDPKCTRKHDSGEDWIRYAADDQLDQARKRGLIGQAN